MKTQLGTRPTAPQSPCQFFCWQSVILQNSQDYIFHAIFLNIVLNKEKKKKKKKRKEKDEKGRWRQALPRQDQVCYQPCGNSSMHISRQAKYATFW